MEKNIGGRNTDRMVKAAVIIGVTVLIVAFGIGVAVGRWSV